MGGPETFVEMRSMSLAQGTLVTSVEMWSLTMQVKPVQMQSLSRAKGALVTFVEM